MTQRSARSASMTTPRMPQSRHSPSKRVIVGMIAWAMVGATASATDRITPPERRIPRYMSLGSDLINARVNAGPDERIKWIYHSRGLPVQVVAQWGHWLRICDPEGNLSWVDQKKLARQRSVMNIADRPSALRNHGYSSAAIVAYLAPRALGRLDHCAHGWCRIAAGRIIGWAPAGALWGTLSPAQCGLNTPLKRPPN
jgi:SH3-like domain-containing protein